MRIPPCVVDFLIRRLTPLSEREPDEVIGPGTRSRKANGHVDVPKAFLIRWFVIPKNRWVNVYLHKFIRDDEDRALHDHPFLFSISCLVLGSYYEVTMNAGGVRKRTMYSAGSVRLIGPWKAHRIELTTSVVERSLGGGQVLWNRPKRIPCWSLFITGPKVRTWGFHCLNGWKPSDGFTKAGGCGEDN